MTALVPSRYWLAGLIVFLAWAAVLPGSGQQADAPGRVTCRVRDDARGREFVLRPADPQPGAPEAQQPAWELSMRDIESRSAWIDLPLPGAKPALTATTAKLSYRNANGGRQVSLQVSPAGSSLDVWVDHGLEVNIEPDLDPRVDRLNTDGPITTLECTMTRAAP